MTGQGWTEGDIRSRGYSHIPDEDWNRIFGKKDRLVGTVVTESDEQKISKPSPWLEMITKSQDELDDEEVELAQKTCE